MPPSGNVYSDAVHAFNSLKIVLKSNAADVPPFVHSPHVPVLTPVLAIWTALAAQPVAWSLVEVPATGNVYPGAVHVPHADAENARLLTLVPEFEHSVHVPVKALPPHM